jgi:hypothetical protein
MRKDRQPLDLHLEQNTWGGVVRGYCDMLAVAQYEFYILVAGSSPFRQIVWNRSSSENKFNFDI